MPDNNTDTRHEAQPMTVGDALDDLESSLAEPDPDDWSDMRAHGIERRDYIQAWRTAKRLLLLHEQEVAGRLGDEADVAECHRLATLGVIARLQALVTALTWDARNARAERDRAERAADVPCHPGLWARYDCDAGEVVPCAVWQGFTGLRWAWGTEAAPHPDGLGFGLHDDADLWRGPWAEVGPFPDGADQEPRS